MAEKALTAVIQKAYVQGISIRSVDDPIRQNRLRGAQRHQAGVLSHQVLAAGRNPL
jgi:transposase-like protein